MFVLPELSASRPAPPAAESALPDPPLPPALLAYWGLPIHSVLPEEGVARTEIMEEYLLGLARWVRLRNVSLHDAYNTALAGIVRDEAIEREFIEEDAAFLVWRRFIDHTRHGAVVSLEKREELVRRYIVDEFFASALKDLVHFETLHRQHVARQFLDSLFLKLCQVKPGWMWRRVPPLLDEDSAAAAATVAAAQTEAAAPSWIEALAAEECAARRCITDKFFAGLFLVVEVFAAAEKRIMHSMHRHQAGVTSLSEIGRMATVIQAAFRGYRVRHRNAIAAGQAKVKAM